MSEHPYVLAIAGHTAVHYGDEHGVECGADWPFRYSHRPEDITCRTCRWWLPIVAPTPIFPQIPRKDEEPFSEGFWAGRMSDRSKATGQQRECAYQAYMRGERWNRADGNLTPLHERSAQPESVNAVDPSAQLPGTTSPREK